MDMGYTIAIAALTAVAGVLAVVLWRTLAARVGERSAAEEALAAERAAAERLRGEVADERIARVRVESELAALREREQTSRRDREELERTMTAQFRSLAGEIFGEQSREFRRTNRESLDMLLKPFKDNITEFRERVERIYASENEQRGALKNELDNLMRLNVRMTAEATNLTNALRGNSKTQGDWGEVYLETILSSTGLVKGLHYDVQANLKDETGRNLRPDVLLRLPEERSIVIDSKVSLTAYVNFTAAETEEERRRMMSEHVAELAQIVADQHVDVVTTGAGSPAPYIEMWKEAGVKVMPVVASTALAKRMERAGADAVVAEGQEAGGHIGELTTMVLVPAVCEAVSIPVVAAGGIADGRGMAAAFALGGEAVQVGTRFLTAEECTIHENFKEKVMGAKDSDTIVTGRLQGHPVRQLKNKFARTVKALEEQAATDSSIDLEGIHAGSLRKAVVDGNTDEGSFMAGQVAALVCERKSAAEIIDGLMADAERWGALNLQQMADANAVRGWRG